MRSLVLHPSLKLCPNVIPSKPSLSSCQTKSSVNPHLRLVHCTMAGTVHKLDLTFEVFAAKMFHQPGKGHDVKGIWYHERCIVNLSAGKWLGSNRTSEWSKRLLRALVSSVRSALPIKIQSAVTQRLSFLQNYKGICWTLIILWRNLILRQLWVIPKTSLPGCSWHTRCCTRLFCFSLAEHSAEALQCFQGSQRKKIIAKPWQCFPFLIQIQEAESFHRIDNDSSWHMLSSAASQVHPDFWPNIHPKGSSPPRNRRDLLIQEVAPPLPPPARTHAPKASWRKGTLFGKKSSNEFSEETLNLLGSGKSQLCGGFAN